MQVQSARYNADGSIECEVQTSTGLVPFTARETDPSERGRKIYRIAKAMADGTEIPSVGDDQLQPPSPDEIMQRARATKRTDKLDLVRALKQMQRWEAFKAALEVSPDATEEWAIAGSLRRMDIVFSGIMWDIGMSVDEIDIAFGMRRLIED